MPMPAWAQIQVGHLQKPSGQAPQDHPIPTPPCSPAHKPWGSLGELLQPPVASAPR